MTPRPLAATLSAAVKDQILDAIMTTVTHIHDATDIMAFCKVLFGEAETERANEVRKIDAQQHFEIDGSTGEAPANRSSARAYVLLVDAGEEHNAREWSGLIMGKHFQRLDIEAEVENVRGGF